MQGALGDGVLEHSSAGVAAISRAENGSCTWPQGAGYRQKWHCVWAVAVGPWLTLTGSKPVMVQPVEWGVLVALLDGDTQDIGDQGLHSTGAHRGQAPQHRMLAGICMQFFAWSSSCAQHPSSSCPAAFTQEGVVLVFWPLAACAPFLEHACWPQACLGVWLPSDGGMSCSSFCGVYLGLAARSHLLGSVLLVNKLQQHLLALRWTNVCSFQHSLAPGACRQVDELQQQLRHSQGETAKLRDWQDITKQVHADRMQEAGQLAQAEQAKLQALVHQRWAGSSTWLAGLMRHVMPLQHACCPDEQPVVE